MQNSEVKQQLKSIKIIHLALAMGVLVFIIVSLYLVYITGGFVLEDPYFNMIMLLAANLMAVPSITFGQIIFKNKIKVVDNQDLIEKLTIYRSAMIIRAATIEGPAFFFIVCYLITGYYLFILEAVVVLMILLFFFPTNSRIAREINHDARLLER